MSRHAGLLQCPEYCDQKEGVIRFIVRFPAVGYCFAAAVTAEDALKAKAISWVMVGGLAGAIIGPQLVIFTRDAVAGTPTLAASSARRCCR